MVSLFGRGFDSLQLHHLSKCKPLTFKQLAASLCPASLDRDLGKVGTPKRDAFESSVDEVVYSYKLGEAIRKARLCIGRFRFVKVYLLCMNSQSRTAAIL